MTTTATPPFPANIRFEVIYADPPWRDDQNSTTPNRRIERHYPTMPLYDIITLPVQTIAARNSVLYLWSSVPKLEEALEVMRAWGFKYRSALAWVKDRTGPGYWARSRMELCLIGKRGNFHSPPPSTRPDQVLQAPRRTHSYKPHQFYEMIERMYPDRSKIELFARAYRQGWASWGNEV